MKKLFIATILLLGFAAATVAQNDMDAFRFSQYDYEGTARFMGAGGAFSAVGAEFSALNVNPAAIGVFKKNEISFTPLVISIYNNNSLYNGHNSRTSNVKYSLTNAGGAFRIGLPEGSGWKSINLGFGYNRICDYNNGYRIEGMSQNSSMMDEYLSDIQGKNLSSLSDNELLAFKTWMIDTIAATHYYSPFAGKSLNQKLVAESSGANDEMAFSIGGNYNDQLFIGATIGVPIINYNEKTKYTEKDDDLTNYISSFDITENLRVRTTGVNLKLGVIYQPVEFVRVGAAFHTPSYFGRVRNTYTRTMTSYYPDGTNSGTMDNSYSFNYTLHTPLRAIGSVAFLIKKRAFVSAEYEYTGYNMSRMNSNDYSFDEENETIQNKYGACHTVRVGGEVYLTNNFLLRAGYNFKSSAYRNTVNNNAMHTASAGFGFRTKYFFCDFAYVFKTKNENLWLYDSDFVDPASLKTNTHRVVATIGCKF
ncbi:MAG: outer membrane protein transport protein [Bacteroidales bacterium]|nr:outer membrane protein transport protein [Bacteroidales bacterium]